MILADARERQAQSRTTHGPDSSSGVASLHHLDTPSISERQIALFKRFPHANEKLAIQQPTLPENLKNSSE